jgi:hypothetical protein
MYTYIRKYTYVYLRIHTEYVYILMYTYVYMYTYVCILTYTYVYMVPLSVYDNEYATLPARTVLRHHTFFKLKRDEHKNKISVSYT